MHKRFTTLKSAATFGLAAAVTLLAACGTDASSASDDLAMASASEHGVTLRDAWARVADSAGTSGAYGVLLNSNTDSVEITGASSDMADVVEIHETMQHGDMVHMMPRGAVAIAAGDSVVMDEGGIHFMLGGLHRTLKAGHRVPLVLRLSSGDSLVIELPVRAP